MPESVAGKKVFSLGEVTKSIQKTIESRYSSAFWVKAEMIKLNFYHRSGHCYPDLVEKKDGHIIAQMRANLWSSDYQRINDAFIEVLKEPLKDGIKLLFLATVKFHPHHGLSLQILEIDPSFTLGDLEREKQETLEKLRAEGILSANKSLRLPKLPQRIAIISVETSKGYADFLKVLGSASQRWPYTFFHMLFPSLLQGDGAVATLIEQLRNIRKVLHHFDVVAIVRGGGGDVGLTCYNHHRLAREIAQFPIPVITGIGHATNETVAEMVAHKNAITPTELADFLIQEFHNFSVPVNEAEQKLHDLSLRLLRQEKATFSSEVKLLRSITQRMLDLHQHQLSQQAESLHQQTRFQIRKEKTDLRKTREELKRSCYLFTSGQQQRLTQFTTELRKEGATVIKQEKLLLTSLEQQMHQLDPRNVLKRGYSITQSNGKAIRSVEEMEEGAELNTILYQGNVRSTVKSVKKSSDHE